MDRFSQLKAFSLVASSGGFSAAARHLGVAPSSVVRLIDSLEARIGAKLLNRSTRTVTLTDAGRAYHGSALKILEQMEEADIAASRETEPQGRLKVTAPVTFSGIYIAPVVAELRRLYPRLKLELDLSDGLSNIIDESIDVAIRIGVHQEQSGLVARKLLDHDRVICASPDYLDKNGSPQEPDDLSRHNCLLFSYGAAQRAWRLKLKSVADAPVEEIAVKGSLSVNNSAMLRQAALAGHGLAMLPEWLVHKDLASGALRGVLSAYVANPGAMNVGIFAIYPANRGSALKVHAFVDLLDAQLTATLKNST
jgi:DNA-binding transcriptional LysR family regulator